MVEECLHFSFGVERHATKILKCQDIPLTGAKSCQDAAPRIYFNKLKPELFFPGVSFGFWKLSDIICRDFCQRRLHGTAANSEVGCLMKHFGRQRVKRMIIEQTFFCAMPLHLPFPSSVNHVAFRKLCVLFQELKQDLICQFFPKRKGKAVHSVHSNRTTMQEKHTKHQTMSLIMPTEFMHAEC